MGFPATGWGPNFALVQAPENKDCHYQSANDHGYSYSSNWGHMVLTCRAKFQLSDLDEENEK